jgi:hypothetical protein
MSDDIDPPEKPPAADKTWLDILGQRIDENARPVSAAPAAPAGPAAPAVPGVAGQGGPPRSLAGMRFTDLMPPKRPAAGVQRQTDLYDASVHTGTTEKLRSSEQARAAAEARVVELEKEVARLRDLVGQSDAAELDELRTKLAEAHAIIQAIEQAYLAGER